MKKKIPVGVVIGGESRSGLEFDDYRAFLRAKFANAPKGGYGQAKRLAEYLQVHTTLVSQVLKGIKTFTLEQAALVTEYLGFTELECDYFMLLVQLDRAGNEVLRRQIRRQIASVKNKSKELVNRLQAKRRLTEPERAMFYSDWSFSAIRQMTAIKGYQSPETIAKGLDLPIRQVKDALEFLIKTGLCRMEDGKLTIGSSSTHLESKSPWVRSHHINWRLRSVELMRWRQDESLRYTAPMTLSAKDARKIREMIAQFLEKIDKVVEDSPSEELHCLTIDWFRADGRD